MRFSQLRFSLLAGFSLKPKPHELLAKMTQFKDSPTDLTLQVQYARCTLSSQHARHMMTSCAQTNRARNPQAHAAERMKRLARRTREGQRGACGASCASPQHLRPARFGCVRWYRHARTRQPHADGRHSTRPTRHARTFVKVTSPSPTW